MNEEPLLGELKEIFHIVNNWLLFAEAKNGVIIGIIGGIIYSFNSYENEFNKYIFIFMYFILIFGFLSSMLSFYPNVTNVALVSSLSKIFFKIAKFPMKKSISIEGNPNEIKIFYGDIASNYEENDCEKYLYSINKDYFKNDRTDFTSLEKDYAKEIIILSKLTFNKYMFFTASLKLILFFTFLFVLELGYNKLYEIEYYFVAANNVIVREYPNMRSKKKFELNKYDFVKKINKEQEWIEIEINNNSGWIHKRLLEKR